MATLNRTQEETLLSGFAHVAVLFGWLGVIGNLVLYLIYKPKSAFVAGHAKQALGLAIVWRVLGIVLGIFMGGLGAVLTRGPWSMMGPGVHGGLVIGSLVSFGIWVAFLVLVILAAIKGFGGKEHRYPIIGDAIDRLG